MTRPRQRKTIATLGWERLHHPSRSPDLTLSDFHAALKKNLVRMRFGSNAEVKQAIKLFFRMQSPEFFLKGFLKFIKQYDKCLNVLGTYVEKYTFVFSLVSHSTFRLSYTTLTTDETYFSTHPRISHFQKVYLTNID
ncbi:histone-lysine N-methyltransferase SETMAR [Trichonephila clavipes]|nr:histone-lysine N-methyltransferase SETMAR [Trichonephila clavipes]